VPTPSPAADTVVNTTCVCALPALDVTPAKADTFGFPKTFKIETSENATGPWQLRMVLGLNASQQCCAEHANYTYDYPLRYDDRIDYINAATWLADKTPTRYIRTFFYDIPTKYNTTGYNFS